MQFAPLPSLSSVPLKIIINPQTNKQLIKRVTVTDCTYDKLTEVITEWAPWGGRIQYVDVEGDLIEIGSDEEWGECVRHVREHLQKETIALRVTVNKRRECKSKVKNEVKSTVIHDQGDKVNQQAMQATVTAILRYKHGRECLESADQRELVNSQEDWIDIRGSPPELTLDVDLPKLRQTVNTHAMTAIAARHFEEALRWLTLGLVIFPTYNVFFYNMACASSLSGDVASAISSIKQAIDHGYRNGAHLRTDPDLAEARKSPEFDVLLQSLAAPAEAEAKVEAEFPFLEQLRQLNEMGIRDTPDIRELLSAHNGDIPRILEICLS